MACTVFKITSFYGATLKCELTFSRSSVHLEKKMSIIYKRKKGIICSASIFLAYMQCFYIEQFMLSERPNLIRFSTPFDKLSFN
ncbi:hypothetical protein BpHYR1_047543 [Brachionus plicatilis]|uniref:Uncharacterized protein n=1 Tax=Brachionus plicatilis TaxID=10195 RepID=A0A3M7PM74_BRAPC|nr:hypothetical protein BpHYR1_047543 [Brachionus plicatilis]